MRCMQLSEQVFRVGRPFREMDVETEVSFPFQDMGGSWGGRTFSAMPNRVLAR